MGGVHSSEFRRSTLGVSVYKRRSDVSSGELIHELIWAVGSDYGVMASQ